MICNALAYPFLLWKQLNKIKNKIETEIETKKYIIQNKNVMKKNYPYSILKKKYYNIYKKNILY